VPQGERSVSGMVFGRIRIFASMQSNRRQPLTSGASVLAECAVSVLGKLLSADCVNNRLYGRSSARVSDLHTSPSLYTSKGRSVRLAWRKAGNAAREGRGKGAFPYTAPSDVDELSTTRRKFTSTSGLGSSISPVSPLLEIKPGN